jgi:hypothetical protein
VLSGTGPGTLSLSASGIYNAYAAGDDLSNRTSHTRRFRTRLRHRRRCRRISHAHSHGQQSEQHRTNLCYVTGCRSVSDRVYARPLEHHLHAGLSTAAQRSTGRLLRTDLLHSRQAVHPTTMARSAPYGRSARAT